MASGISPINLIFKKPTEGNGSQETYNDTKDNQKCEEKLNKLL